MNNYKVINYKIITHIFEGIIFDINSSPSKLHDLFTHIKNVEVEIIQSIYFIKLRGIFIANIHNYQLELTPGIFINRDINVFKTYNKILKVLVKNRFIKFINGKWILCYEIN